MSGAALEALQAALASQHATIWAYGEIGAAVAPVRRKAIAARDNAHRTTRGRIEDLVRARGGTPVAAQAGYALPGPLDGNDDALALAAQVEDTMAQHWRHCIGAEDADVAVREACLGWLFGCTDAALRWRRALDPDALPPALPGLA